jgi:hypothetical protein
MMTTTMFIWRIAPSCIGVVATSIACVAFTSVPARGSFGHWPAAESAPAPVAFFSDLEAGITWALAMFGSGGVRLLGSEIVEVQPERRIRLAT